MAALELSVDMDWVRLKASGLWSSGDREPTDGTAQVARAFGARVRLIQQANAGASAEM